MRCLMNAAVDTYKVSMQNQDCFMLTQMEKIDLYLDEAFFSIKIFRSSENFESDIFQLFLVPMGSGISSLIL